MDRRPKPGTPSAADLQDAIRELTGYLQERPLATAALLTLALAIGAGASSIGRRPAVRPQPRLPRGANAGSPVAAPPALRPSAEAPAAAMPTPAPPAVRARRRPPKRKGMGVASFEFEQTRPGGRKTEIDFTWAAPKPKPGAPPPPADLRESRVGVGLFEFAQSRPGGKDTAFKFGWSKDPLEPAPPAPPATAADGSAPAGPAAAEVSPADPGKKK